MMIIYQDVTVSFEGKTLFRDFNLKVDKGDKVLLYGRSGSGKSTLLNMLLGFSRPSKGRVTIAGKELDPGSIWELRKKIAYISQDVDIGSGRVEDLISEINSYKSNSGLEFRPGDYLEQFDLSDDILSKDIEDLSGGERQRVAIIIGLMLNRDIFLLDEITSSLDKRLKKKVVDYFTQDKCSRDWTVIAVSHDDEWLRDNVKIVRM